MQYGGRPRTPAPGGPPPVTGGVVVGVHASEHVQGDRDPALLAVCRPRQGTGWSSSRGPNTLNAASWSSSSGRPQALTWRRDRRENRARYSS